MLKWWSSGQQGITRVRRALQSQDSNKTKIRFMKPGKIALVFVALSFFAPYLIAFSTSGFAVGAMTWILNVRPFGFAIDFQNPSYWFGMGLLVIGLPQFVFSYFMYRFYQKKTTRNRLVHVGVIGMLPIIIWGILNGLPRLWNPTYPYGFNMLPIPIILLVAFLFLKRYSPPPIEEDKTLQWLESDK
jgi:hypothetical protein